MIGRELTHERFHLCQALSTIFFGGVVLFPFFHYLQRYVKPPPPRYVVLVYSLSDAFDVSFRFEGSIWSRSPFVWL